MSRVHVRAVIVLGAVTAMVGCSSGGGDVSITSSNAGRHTSLPRLPPPARAIDWDRPLAASVRASRSEARGVGQLSFDPLIPSWSVRESAVYVSDASRIAPEHAAVALVYTFPTGPDFPSNGQVVMVQRRTDETEASFDEIVRSNGSDNFRVIQINGHPALLVEADGIGRVRVIRGGVLIDITGPATPSASVVKLATELG